MKPTAILALTLLVACGGDDDGMPGAADAAASEADADPSEPDARTGPDGQPREFTNHIIADDCAPNDGPALRLFLTDDTIGPNCRSQGGFGRSVEIRIYTRDIQAPETITFSEDSFTGSGSECPGGTAPCRVTQDGEIHFETYEADVGATGTFRLELEGSAIEGSFDADWCDPDDPLLCG